MQDQPQSPIPSSPSRNARILDAVVRTHQPALRAQAIRHASDPDAALDAFQDGCLEFLRYYSGPSGADALRYLMVAIKHAAWAIASCRRDCPLDLTPTAPAAAWSGGGEALNTTADPGLDPTQLAERSERTRERRATLRRLKPDQQTALALQAAGFSYAEIAARRNWTYTKVNRCLAEGRAALRAASG